MPGARTWVKPLSATEPSASDEASLLDIYLQRQLEEDIARIFDESIYSDLEVVCGKLKILTHSCILKARTNEFYNKLQTILHVNVGRGIFDEIYSFVSDAYTECNIRNQEKEILEYLNKTFKVLKVVPNNNYTNKEDSEETEVFLTPNCLSPYVDKSCQKSISSSPSTELTKEYYALVPIEGNILEKELKEQDALSNAFHSIKQTQSEDINKAHTLQCNKPTSLSLTSSHTSKPVTHSNSCDILIKSHLKDNIATSSTSNVDKVVTTKGFNFTSNQVPWRDPVKSGDGQLFVEKIVEPVYSPDSLIADDPSSSSDYLSAAYTFSPGASYSACVPQLNVADNTTKMEKLFTSSDSGLENTGLLESLSSHKDVALADLSLTESTLHDLTLQDDTQFTSSSPIVEGNLNHRVKPANPNNVTSLSSHAEINGKKMNHPSIHKDVGCCKSSKEEKQRQNEEIFTMESSSLSSETGSWESVYPPKLAEREICEKFINKERQYAYSKDVQGDLCPSLVQKSPFKSTSCFIDAASLADEEDDNIKAQVQLKEPINIPKSDVLPTPSQPVPCSTAKVDLSPNDWSESNDNDDSLEQPDNKDPDSIQKDLSPTIFEMTPITDDSLCLNTNEDASLVAKDSKKKAYVEDSTNHNPDKHTSLSNTVFVTSTPYNSIMSLNACPIKNPENRIDLSLSGPESLGIISLKKHQKFNESSPIVSGGASIDDYKPQSGSHSDSPITRRRIENTPIVSGAYIPPAEEVNRRKSPKPSSAATWVVDMSLSPKVDREEKSVDRVCKLLKNESMGSSISDDINKSPSSTNNDSNERSSQKFYIDLSSLPDFLPPKTDSDIENSSEKKNMFSMYIDLGEKLILKEMPSRLSLNTKKNTSVEVKSKSVASKGIKGSADNSVAPSSNKCESGSPGTFEKYESLCNDLNISISEIISCPGTKPEHDTVVNNGTNDSEAIKEERPPQISGVDNSSLQQDYIIHKEPPESDQAGDLFVKLSDLDKPALKSDPPTITTVYEDTVSDVRMTRSIPDNNWGKQSNSTSRPIDVISSFHSENALSLNRLFPHLKNEFSKSMPGSLSSKFRSRASSRRDMEEQPSDVSELSSVQSSMCRSIVDNSTTEDTTSQTSSLIVFCQSRLGQDLLRMFLEEITPDVIVEVSGRRIKAHKCILSSRCQYFARILSGGWVESAGNVIVLPPFSFNVVHFALCHIYSGMSTIPDSISIVELATLADMLGLEGLKEAIMFTLKAKYCHHFHKPCAVCTAGVLECFPLSSVYSLDDLYRKCLRWITKHFSKVWPTKAFATLPKELLDKCYQQHIVNLTTDNLVDTVYGCGITVASLQNSRWAECVARMCRRLVVAIAQFAAPRLAGVLAALRATPPRAPPAATQALHDCLAAAIEWAPPDEAARAYALLSALVVDAAAAASAAAAHRARPDLITDGARPPPSSLLAAHAASWRLQCEGALVRAAPRAVHTQAFKDLPPELRKRLRELGCIMYGPQVVPAASPLHDRKTRSAYHPKPCKAQGALATRSLDIDQVRASFVPYAPKPGVHAGTAAALRADTDQCDRRPARMIPPKIRTTKAQEERAKFNMAKTNHQSQDRMGNKAGGRIKSFEKTKPRYLEPRLCKEGEKKSPAAKKLMNKMVSSSESSRNSSPILARNVRASRVRSRESGAVAGTGPGAGPGARASALSQDSLASGSRPRTAEPSTDSLSESQNSNKYATYTKRKSGTKGSVESIQSTKYQSSLQSSSSVNKMKTKIPVYLNQSTKSYQTTTHQAQNSHHVDAQKRLHQPHKATALPPVEPRARAPVERKLPGSLMNATKSSSAKIVSKPPKEKQTKGAPKPIKGQHKHTSRQEIYEQSVEIPVMQRSGTFLKDEPTFGDITTNIDVDHGPLNL